MIDFHTGIEFGTLQYLIHLILAVKKADIQIRQPKEGRNLPHMEQSKRYYSIKF